MVGHQIGTRSLLVGAAVAFLAVGCANEVSGPEPTIPAPSAERLPLEPSLVCRDQRTTEVVVKGERFSPMPIDVPGDPRTALPTLRLSRTAGVTGEAADAFEVVYGGQPDAPNAAALSWQSQSQMTFVVDQALHLADGSEGVLEPGIYDVGVTNPNETGSVSQGALAVVPRPSAETVSPGIVCLAEGARTVTISGTTFVRLGEAMPTLRSGEHVFQAPALTDCTAVAHAGLDAETCANAAFELSQEVLVPGLHELVLHNPETAACHSEEAIALRVVPPPTITSVAPAMVCAAESDRDVVLHGEGFLEIDQVLPTATLDGAQVTVLALDGCEALETQGHAVRVCTQLLATVPTQNPAEPFKPQIVVTNPGPAGCSGSAATELMIVPDPIIASAEPALTCVAQGARDVIVHGEGFISVDGVLPALTIGGDDAFQITSLADCTALDVPGMTVERCTQALVTLPEASLTEGVPTLVITNPDPAGCSAEHDTALRIVDPPTITSAEPALVCNVQSASEIVLTGTGFLSVDGLFPEVTLDGVAVSVSSLGGTCEALATAGLTVQRCTEATILVPAATVTSGTPEIVLTNPAPAGCTGANGTALVFVPPPELQALVEPLACLAEAGRAVLLQGTGFLEVNATTPTVTFGTQTYPVEAMTGCTALVVEGLAARSCTEMQVTIPQNDLIPGLYDVSVTNPAPAGCGELEAGFFAVTPPPDIAAVMPPAICDDGTVATLTLTGSSFLVVEGTNPAVALDGAALDPAAVVAADCIAGTLAGVAVESCSTLTVSVDATALTADVTLSVSNPAPAGCSDTHSDSIVLLSPPRIDSAAPSLVCTDEGARTIELLGANFLAIPDAAGTLPSVTLGGVSVSVDAMAGCTPVTIGPVSAVRCDQLTVSAPQGSLATGDLEIVVANPSPLACAGSAVSVLDVPPQLTITAVQPASVCDTNVPASVLVQGDGFLRIGGSAPTVTLAGTPVPVLSMTGCVSLDVAGSVVESCTELEAQTPTGLPLGAYDLTVTNAAPSGCSQTAAGAFLVSPPPTVSTVAPSAVCEELDAVVTITGLAFTSATTVTVSNAGGSYPATSVSFVSSTQLEATFAAGSVPGGSYDLTVSNGAGCESTLLGALDIKERPFVFFVDPPVAYNGIEIQATIYTSGLDTAAALVNLVAPDGTRLNLADAASVPGEPNKIVATLPSGLTPGAYDLEVQSQTGCLGTLIGGLTVTDALTVTVTAISPDAVSPHEETAVTLTGEGFLDTPRVYLSPVGGGLATALRAVVFVDANTLTGVVRGGMTPGTYHVILTNPDSSVGLLGSGLTVLPEEPPVITAVLPNSMTNDQDETGTILGERFDVTGVTVTMTCQEPGLATPTGPLPVTAAVIDAGTIVATFPTSGLTQHSVCVIDLVNGGGGSFRYAAVSIKNPAYNLASWKAAAPMNDPRRAHALVAGRPTATSRYLYAIGGDDGLTPNATVESARVGIFGALGTWAHQRQGLPTPRTFAGVARIGRFLYLTGGLDNATTTDTVLRAQVLDPLAGPNIYDLSLSLSDGGGLAGGRWYYAVAPTFPLTDPSNPGGEGLPGEPLAVEVPQVGSNDVELTLRWEPTPGAMAYRLYRTPAPNSPPSDMQLLTTVVGGTVTEFTDTGLTTDPAGGPLRSGDLGVWHMVSNLTAARSHHATVAVQSPTNPAEWYLYAIGGRDGAGIIAASYELATVTVAPDGSQTVAQAVAGSTLLSSARAELGAWVITSQDTDLAGPAEKWIFMGAGRSSGGTGFSNRLDAGLVGAGGDLGTLDSATGPSVTHAGYGFGDSTGYLFMFGGRNGSPNTSSQKSQVTALDETATPPAAANDTWTDVGIAMSAARIYMGSADESAFFFVAGGQTGTDGTGTPIATNSVDQTVK